MTCRNLILLLIFLPSVVLAQKKNISTRDSLRQYTYKLVNKALQKRGFKKIAIWDFTDAQKEVSNQGSYISDQVSIYATDIDSVIVLDRQNLASIIREHSLKDKDFLIDKAALLELGKFSGAEVLMVGKVSVFETECAIQIYLKIVDANTAQTLAAAEEYIPVDKKFADVSGLTLNCLGMVGRDYNSSSASNEGYNKSEIVITDQHCEENNTGMCCFFNASGREMNLTFYKISIDNKSSAWEWGPTDLLHLKPAESKCIYNLLAGVSYKFTVLEKKDGRGFTSSELYDEGNILIQKCKSKTYTIKKMVVTETKKTVANEFDKEIKDGLNRGIQFIKDKLKKNN